MKNIKWNFYLSLMLMLMFVDTTFAALVSVDFDDGYGPGNAVDGYYSKFGVSFTNAQWSTIFNGRPGTTSPYQIESISDSTQQKKGNPIIGVFDDVVDFVSLSAIDVGYNGARIDVYDSAIGGNLIGFDEYIGLTPLGNAGNSYDTSVLVVSVAGIRRFEIYQPLNVRGNDGVSWDNLQFNTTSIPAPPTLSFLITGLLVFFCFGKYKKLLVNL